MSATPTGSGPEAGAASSEPGAKPDFAATLDEVSPTGHAAPGSPGIAADAPGRPAAAMMPGNNLPGDGKTAAASGKDGDALADVCGPATADQVIWTPVPALLGFAGEPIVVASGGPSPGQNDGRAPSPSHAGINGSLPFLSESGVRAQSPSQALAALPPVAGEAVAVEIRAAGVVPLEAAPASALSQVRVLDRRGDGSASSLPQGAAASAAGALGIAGAAVASTPAPADRGADSGNDRGQPAEGPLAAPDRQSSQDRAGASGPAISAGGATASPAADRAAAASAPSFAVDRPSLSAADAVASVVDRLLEARALGPAASARMAVVHAEFGQLEITFARSGSTMDVAVSAADNESQVALAAALQSADRGSGRDQGQADSGARNSATAQRATDGASNSRDGEPQQGAPHADSRRSSRDDFAAADPFRADDTPTTPPTARHARRAGIYA